MTTADPILSRIQKLLALATSDNVHESAQAAAAAQRLMLQHGIDSADLAPPSVQEIILDHDLANDTWFQILAKHVGESCFCRTYGKTVHVPGRVNRRTVTVMLGRANDVAVASVLLAWLAGEVNRLADKDWVREERGGSYGYGKPVHGKTWKNSFRQGAVKTLGERLQTSRKTDVAAQSSTALVKLETYATAAKEAITKHLGEQGVKLRSSATRNRVDRDGFGAGVVAGAGINLTAPTRALGSGK